MKKGYMKPEAEKISFQAEEVMTDDFDGSVGGTLVDWTDQNS